MNRRKLLALRATEARSLLSWGECALRVLAVHYFAPKLELIFEPGCVYVFAGMHEICRGDTLGQALELAVSALSDAELLAAMEDT
ncbi:MAG TPA: hypothetical protein VNO55_31690 [Polyangia bacterium]|nr:hypothetical protein [Polyangia bacterium]